MDLFRFSDPLWVDFILNYRLVESLEEVDEENKSDIGNEEMEIDNPNERYVGA